MTDTTNDLAFETTLKDSLIKGAAYFKDWTLRDPLLINATTNKELKQVQTIILKIATHFVTNYRQYESLMPVSKATKRILSFVEGKAYQPGSYRTDFVIDKKKQFKLIEITSRFALNGFLLTGFLEYMAKTYANKQALIFSTIDKYPAFIDFIQHRLKNKKITVLSHLGKLEESHFFLPLFKKAGYDINRLYSNEIEANLLEKNNNQVFITELNQEDYYELSDRVLEILAASDMMNDLRTIFLVHDKRFFSILGKEAIRKAVLTKEEIELLDKYYIPTYCYGEHQQAWKKARQQKDQWILKHKHLGKSAKVHAGSLSTKEEWEAIFQSEDLPNMILQPFIQQNPIKGYLGEGVITDYLAGTLLFFDDHYFGLGLFRSSTTPVTAFQNNRKVMHLNLSNDDSIKGFYQF